MKKKLLLLMAVIMTCVTMCGCTSDSVELSDEDSKKVANYSSDILSQYNTNSNSRLVDENEVKKEYQKQLDLDIKKQNFEAEQAAATAAAASDGSGSASEDETAVPQVSLAEAIGIGDFDIEYQGYDIKESYPDSVSGDIYMGMSAAEGDRLLILRFRIANPGDTDAQCDILDLKPTFRVKINGEKTTVQQTILDDDMMTFDDTIAAGGEADVVMISEVASDRLDDIQSLGLIVRSAEGRPEYTLE